jgi:hypothetical protein
MERESDFFEKLQKAPRAASPWSLKSKGLEAKEGRRAPKASPSYIAKFYKV